MQKPDKWNDCRADISQYCRENKISREDFHFLGVYQWQNVYEKVLEHFIDWKYAKRNGLHWANTEGGFRCDLRRVYAFQAGVRDNLSYEWLGNLPEIVDCEKVYLLLEEAGQKYWVAECRPRVVCPIINQAIGYTDYYITDKKFSWIISENHHDIVQFWGDGLDADVIRKYTKKRPE